MTAKKIFKRFLKATGALLGFILLWFLVTLVLERIPYNAGFRPCTTNAVDVYIRSNGVHTDLVLPMRNSQMDWTKWVRPSDSRSGDSLYEYVAFGWGDKGFYLETPTWSQLKFRTAFNALFFLSTTAMHVSFYKEMKEGQQCRKISITRESYEQIVKYVEKSFRTEAGQPVIIRGASYGDNDVFYDARGTYSLFYTCNTWTNEGLKAAGMKACQWTLFEKAILKQYTN